MLGDMRGPGRLARLSSIEELRAASRRRWPGFVWDFVEGGADAELSLGWNRAVFDSYLFLPTVLRDVSDVQLSGEFLGRKLALPFGLAPTGYTRVMHADGEPAVARVAADAGIPYIVSAMSTTSVEEISAHSNGDLWFQTYVTRDHTATLSRLKRARDSGFRVLVLTVDTPVTGRRARDLRNNFALPPRPDPKTLLRMAARPRWLAGFVRSWPIAFPDFPPKAGSTLPGAATLAGGEFDTGLSWADIDWLRRGWEGPLVLKGIGNANDAVRAHEEGVDAIILSNHGGRQLDKSVPPLLLVPEVRARVGSEFPVYLDSGIRTGSDIALALALGADGCFVGRPYLYGLGAAGAAGCRRAVEILAEELGRAMRLLGVNTVRELRRRGPELVGPRTFR